MRKSDFDILSEREKMNIVLNGQYLVSRIENKLSVQLYAVEDFFVEVLYNPKFDNIVKIVAFNETCHLEPYFKDISLQAVNE